MAGNPSLAQELDLHGYAEAAVVDVPGTLGWSDGGFGKLRWEGAGPDRQASVQLNSVVLEGTLTLPADLHLLADLRYTPRQKSGVDLLDAVLSWRPEAAGAWSWSAKAGAFFPPFGLENTDLGWSSPWTVTESALSSWLGEELRTIGGEATVRRHLGEGSLNLTAALFAWNDAAGALLAKRGWDVGGQPLGLTGHIRIPDIAIDADAGPPPDFTPEFTEIDNQPGWYAGASWTSPDVGRLQIFRYDNETAPTTERLGVYGWHTRFWELGFTRAMGPFAIIAEGIVGSTLFNPDTSGVQKTEIHTASLLGSWTRNAWRAVLRAEEFGTGGANTEHGTALTSSLNWSRGDSLRLTAEIVVVDSRRAERALIGAKIHVVDTEPLLAARLTF